MALHVGLSNYQHTQFSDFLDGSSKKMNKIIFRHVSISKQQKIFIGNRL